MTNIMLRIEAQPHHKQQGNIMHQAVNTRTITGIGLVLFVVSSAYGQVLPSVSNLQLRLTADSGTSTTVDGAGVADWFDTAHGHFFFNANDTLPTYVADSGGGVPAIDFERSSGFLGDFSASAGSTITDATIFVVARFDGYEHSSSSSSYFYSIDNFADPGIPDSSEHTLGRDLSTLGPDQLYHWRGQPDPPAAYGTNILEDQPGTPFGDFNYYTAIFRGADDGGGAVNEMEAWINGSSGATSTPDVAHNGSGYSALPSETRIGLWTSNGSGLDGMIREVLIYNRVLNSQEITDVEGYLAERSLSPVAPTLLLQVDRDTRNVVLKNVSGANLDLSGYLAGSASGALDRTLWTSIAGTYDQDNDGTVDPNNVWQEAGSAADNTLEESATSGFATLAPNQEIALGATWTPYFAEDVTFEFTDGSSAVVIAPVQFSGNGGNPFPFGDLDFNGSVGTEDWTALINGYGQDLTGKSVAAAYGLGDLTADGNHSLADIQSFRTAFVAAGGILSELKGWPVPEPASAALLLIAAGLQTARSKTRIRNSQGSRWLFAAPNVGRLLSVFAVSGILLLLAARSAVAALPSVTSGTLVVQFEATDATVTRGGASEVTSWTASNDNSIVLTTSGTAAAATNISYNATGLNGSPTIEVNDFFVDNAHDNLFMQGPVLSGGGPLTSATIFWLGYFDPGRNGSLSDGSGQYAFSMNADGDSGSQFDNQIDDGFFETYSGAGTQRFDNISAHNGAYGVFRTEYYSDGEHAAYRNGVALTGGKVADSPSYSVDDDLILFGYQNGSGTSGGFNFVGNMSQLIIYDSVLDNGDIAAVEDYLTSFLPSELSLTVVTNTGELIFNGGDISRDINGYEIRSAAGSLDPTAWLASNFDAQDIDPLGEGVGESWDTFTSSTTRLTESFLLGSSLFESDRTESLGRSYDTAIDARDLIFEYTDTAGDTRFGVVQYIDVPGLDGDFDVDGDRDGDDLLHWQRELRDAPSLTLWQSNYGVPAASGAAGAVPEPNAMLLSFLGSLGFSQVRRRGGRSRID